MVNYDLIKKIFPRKLLFIIAQLVHPFFYSYYLFKFKTLIIRKQTTDKHIFRQIFISGHLRIPFKVKPKLIIDGGANVGYSALWFLKEYPNAKIIAIEPEESNYKILRKHSKRWKRNIIPIKAGLWHKNTFLKIIDDGAGEWGFKTEAVNSSKGKGNVKAITVDEILKQSGLNKIDILKIDIEGAEKELFSENYSWLDKVDILLIELHDWFRKGCSESFYSAINKYSWNKYYRGGNLIFVRVPNRGSVNPLTKGGE